MTPPHSIPPSSPPAGLPLTIAAAFALSLLGACGGEAPPTSAATLQAATVNEATPQEATPKEATSLAAAPSNSAPSNAEDATPRAASTPDTPFSARSLWRSRPVAPRLDEGVVLPQQRWPGTVGEGLYSTGVFVAGGSEGAVRVEGRSGGLDLQDDNVRAPVTIPHWPSSVRPAEGSDGHAEIIDPATGIIHSFYQLTNDGGNWRATSYSWSRLDGTGWGDPGHARQGTRASGVPVSAGMIRTHEFRNGGSRYEHALAMSLPANALRAGYVFPATSDDSGVGYSGAVPMGALMMLPANFDTSSMATAETRRIAETLKSYGARVVDRTSDTRFVMYAEIGSGYDLHEGGWNPGVARDIDRIGAALRPMDFSDGFIDADGIAFTPDTKLNLMSMRGPWQRPDYSVDEGIYDSWGQQLRFPARDARQERVQWSRTWANETSWAPWVAGRQYRLTVRATGGARLKLQFFNADRSGWHDESPELGDGESFTFTMPADHDYPMLRAYSGIGVESTVGGDLRELR